MKHHPTTVEIKRQYWPQFEAMIRRQFEHGGDKYAFDENLKWTDVIVQLCPNWVEGTILKYVRRFLKYGREKDIAKIVTYCFIVWLQRGHHLKEHHDEDVAASKTDVEEHLSAFPHIGSPAGDEMVPS